MDQTGPKVKKAIQDEHHKNHCRKTVRHRIHKEHLVDFSGSLSLCKVSVVIFGSLCDSISNLRNENIRILNGREVLIENSVTRVTVRHQDAC